jgi:hypothetical protein
MATIHSAVGTENSRFVDLLFNVQPHEEWVITLRA